MENVSIHYDEEWVNKSPFGKKIFKGITDFSIENDVLILKFKNNSEYSCPLSDIKEIEYTSELSSWRRWGGSGTVASYKKRYKIIKKTGEVFNTKFDDWGGFKLFEAPTGINVRGVTMEPGKRCKIDDIIMSMEELFPVKKSKQEKYVRWLMIPAYIILFISIVQILSWLFL